MNNDIDYRHITPKIINMFYDGDTFQKKMKNPLESIPAMCEDAYLQFRESLNKERSRGGHPPLSDSELAQIVKHLIGRAYIPKFLNKQL